MITDKDVKKLKGVFTTKEDLKKMEKKFEEKFATKDELKENINRLVKDITIVIEMLGDIHKKMDDYMTEARGNRVAIGDHEKRIHHLEQPLP
ncbi:MAG: hypothetical protein Q7S61_00380 [bacterium]|nr:hypothetical protein [bacterium]